MASSDARIPDRFGAINTLLATLELHAKGETSLRQDVVVGLVNQLMKAFNDAGVDLSTQTLTGRTLGTEQPLSVPLKGRLAPLGDRALMERVKVPSALRDDQVKVAEVIGSRKGTNPRGFLTIDSDAVKALRELAADALGTARRHTPQGYAKAAGQAASAAGEAMGGTLRRGVEAAGAALEQGARAGSAAVGQAVARGAAVAGRGAATLAALTLAAPVILTRGTIDAVGYAATLVGTALAELKKKLQPLLKRCEDAAEWAGGRAQATLGAIQKGLQAATDWLTERFQALGETVWPVFAPLGPVFSALKEAGDTVAEWSREHITPHAEAAGKAVLSAAVAIRDCLLLALATCEVNALTTGSAIMDWMRQVTFNSIYKTIVAAADSLREEAANIPAKLTAAKTALGEAFSSFSTNVQGTLRSAYESAARRLNVAHEAAQAFGRGTVAAWNKHVKPHLDKAERGIRTFATKVASHLRETTESALEGLAALVKTVNTGLQTLHRRVVGVEATDAEATKVLKEVARLTADTGKGMGHLLEASGAEKAVQDKDYIYATQQSWWPFKRGAMQEVNDIEAEWRTLRPHHTAEEAIARITAIRNSLGSMLLLGAGRAAAAPGELSLVPPPATASALRAVGAMLPSSESSAATVGAPGAVGTTSPASRAAAARSGRSRSATVRALGAAGTIPPPTSRSATVRTGRADLREVELTTLPGTRPSINVLHIPFAGVPEGSTMYAAVLDETGKMRMRAPDGTFLL